MDEVLTPSQPAAESDSSNLTFVVDEKSGALQAIYKPAGAGRAVERHVFDTALGAAGLAGLHLDQEAIAVFLAQCKSTPQALQAVVGQRRDAEFYITVSDDFMTASLTLFGAEGGAGVGTRVEDEMRIKGIMHGIDHAVLDAALKAGHCDNVVIARGSPPREGIPAHFECMLNDRQKALEQNDENAVIKYRDLGHLLLVQPGGKLMHRTPPVQGSNGIDIFGDTVFPRPLPLMEFGDQFPGAEVDPGDPNTLLASIAGQPVVLENGVVVNPVIEVENVDLNTGSITFDGTIKVLGDVKAGMSIKVSGDVIVGGTMEAAQIEAGGNVAVAGGIIGHADSRPGATVLPMDTARIKCKGSAQALFVESAHIEAGDSIVIERSARQCELVALNDVVVGAGKSKSGQLIGGSAQAKHLIKVSILGSTTGVKTRVQVGLDPYAEGDLDDAKKQLAHKNDELTRVLQITMVLRQNPKKGEGGVAERVNSTRERLLVDIAELTTRVEELTAAMAVDEDARLQVDKAIFFGSEVRIGDQVWHIKDDMKGTNAGLVQGRIATGLTVRATTQAAAEPEKELELAAPKTPKPPASFG
jgi:uncharacterized protein (DUF342 family)